ncbi:F-box/kelch-repeat protein At3g23880-like [Lotus japonicus]|uniref:F-box/kelch-repeat protein At3g23880-like n=1 Tax=Lotus japonicus TaxID=34305 RepID=UPI002586C39B|nr:F-box/kelch-repeat protein At3g23880-like [Lotus japonicus]XP_057436200.1 F-box/kelch-repeat protein At3g23880-like [Lotus japonicus]XP_057436201.1 F-box/kelch-repeat protein At3g23880-like [Lotus japonicus]
MMDPCFNALPIDLIPLILVRLPVRSLLRFKCVCKSWRSLISDPEFGKSHFDLAGAPTHRLLLKRINDGSEIQSLDLQASLHDDSAVVNLKFPPYTAPFFQSLGSCRGFVLLTKRLCPTNDLILWNPSTDAHREIPAIFLGGLFNSLYGFGYDQSKDDYVLVLIRLGVRLLEERCQIDVLSLKTNVPSFYYYRVVQYLEAGHESQCGVFLDESLHWLVKSKATQHHLVLAFDLVKRSFSKIPFSPDLAAELATHGRGCLRVLGGCLSVCYSSGGGGHEVAEIWVMKDSWSKLFVLTIHDLVGSKFFPLFSTEGGGVFGSDESGTFRKFNAEGELTELTENYTDGLDDDKGALQFLNMYRESLLTLPGDVEEENVDA